MQSTVGSSTGRYFKNTNHTNISLAFGPAWQNIDYKHSDVPINHQNIAAAIFYDQAQFFKSSKTNLDVTAELLPALSDPAVFASTPIPLITSRSSAI